MIWPEEEGERARYDSKVAADRLSDRVILDTIRYGMWISTRFSVPFAGSVDKTIRRDQVDGYSDLSDEITGDLQHNSQHSSTYGTKPDPNQLNNSRANR